MLLPVASTVTGDLEMSQARQRFPLGNSGNPEPSIGSRLTTESSNGSIGPLDLQNINGDSFRFGNHTQWRFNQISNCQAPNDKCYSIQPDTEDGLVSFLAAHLISDSIGSEILELSLVADPVREVEYLTQINWYVIPLCIGANCGYAIMNGFDSSILYATGNNSDQAGLVDLYGVGAVSTDAVWVNPSLEFAATNI